MKILKSKDLSNEDFNKIYKNNTCFIGIFSNRCPHCVVMKPDWKKLKKKLENVKSNNYLITIRSEDIVRLNDYLFNYVSSKGIPCIIITENGKIKKEFKGERNLKNLYNFFKSQTGGKKTRKIKAINTKRKKLRKKTKKTKKNKKRKNN